MTFCFFSAQYLPTVGGVERYTYNLARSLVQKGHSALVVTSALPGLPAQETQDGIDIVRLPAFLLINGRFPILRPCAALRKAKRALYKTPLDFIVVQTRFYPACLLGARMAKRRKIPAMILEHGTAHLLRGGLAGLLGNAYEHGMLRLIRHFCDNFYGVSAACAAWLSHFGVHVPSDRVLYNAVDPAELQRIAAACGSAFLAPYGCGDPRTLVIAFSGRFIPEKGVLPLLDAFAAVRKKHADAVLLLAGDGPQFTEMKAHLPAGAYLLGMLPHAQNLALLARADLYCLPTFSEGFSTAILEAAALRAAIVTTATGGSPELLCDESYGLLLPDMRAESIAAALERALSDSAWRTAAGENTYRRLTRLFTWDKVSDRLIFLAQEAQSAPTSL
ncbi:MAG: glycosyltransferase family 4 protein [Ruthenibacterium sp.]